MPRRNSKPKDWPIVVKHGSAEAKIYRHAKNGGECYIVAHYEGSVRKQKWLSDLGIARTEANEIVARIANEQIAVLQLTGADRDSYVHAQQLLQALGMPLHAAIEEYVRARAILDRHPLLSAVEDFSKRHREKLPEITVTRLAYEISSWSSHRGQNKPRESEDCAGYDELQKEASHQANSDRIRSGPAAAQANRPAQGQRTEDRGVGRGLGNRGGGDRHQAEPREEGSAEDAVKGGGIVIRSSRRKLTGYRIQRVDGFRAREAPVNRGATRGSENKIGEIADQGGVAQDQRGSVGHRDIARAERAGGGGRERAGGNRGSLRVGVGAAQGQGAPARRAGNASAAEGQGFAAGCEHGVLPRKVAADVCVRVDRDGSAAVAAADRDTFSRQAIGA